jgi:hypothetical protein
MLISCRAALILFGSCSPGSSGASRLYRMSTRKHLVAVHIDDVSKLVSKPLEQRTGVCHELGVSRVDTRTQVLIVVESDTYVASQERRLCDPGHLHSIQRE